MLLAGAAALVFTACTPPKRWVIRSNDGEFIEYAGSATLSGTYFSDPSSEELQQWVCFFPDDASQRSLPRDGVSRSPHWMCFSNSAAAKAWLGLDEALDVDSSCYQGPAEVTVQGYLRYVAESEGVSLAELIQVQRHGAPVAVACPVVLPAAGP